MQMYMLVCLLTRRCSKYIGVQILDNTVIDHWMHVHNCLCMVLFVEADTRNK